MTANNISYVEEWEVPEATRIIEESLGFKAPVPCANLMVVKIFVREEDVVPITDSEGKPVIGQSGQPLYLAVPEQYRALDKFDSVVALVISQGPDCYKDKKYEKSGPYCRVGSWITFPREEGSQINYRGIPVQIIREDHIFETIEDPKFIQKK